MSITTIEMINELQVGQIAKCLDIQECSFGVKIVDGSYFWINIHGDLSELFSLTNDALQYKWEINYEYVRFSEAVEAFINGKTIYSYEDDGKLLSKYNPDYDEDEYISIWEILYCSWSIETF